MKTLIAITALTLFTGCTDASGANMDSIGADHKVTVYSGGQPVRVWHSHGQVNSNGSSDGCYFEDAVTHKLVEVQGPCVIEQE